MDDDIHSQKEIENVSLYQPRPTILHGYVLPFLCIYAIWFAVWLNYYGPTDYLEIGLIGIAFIGLIHILICLFCYWFISFRCLMTCKRVGSIKDASVVKVDPVKNSGSSDLVVLFKIYNNNELTSVSFIFQKTKFEYNFDKKDFISPEYPLHGTVKSYVQSRGLESDAIVEQSLKAYGTNDTTMDIPKFMELFIERATAPFFVFQVFCVGLWCLDEYWYYSLVTLGMLGIFECTLVQQQLKNMSEIRRMGNKPFPIQVYRNKHWSSIHSDQLLPGDLVSIGRSKHDNLIPCDLILLRGTCIVDESMLTGESIPVMKEPLESVEEKEEFRFDERSKLHVLFGGTKVVQHTAPAKNNSSIKLPDTNCLAYVARTGFSTAQGRLLKTILFSVKQVTANNLETFCFILFLLIFAIAASSYVWIKGTEDPSRNRYKLLLECTLIITSVVPPELPIELSLAVNSSLIALTKLLIYCTEPFRIPFAGKVDICCFDKTGTLTRDEMIVEGIAGLGGTSTGATTIHNVNECPVDTIQVLASCHSLVMLDDKTVIGDPLEKAILESTEYNLTRNEVVISKTKRSNHYPLKIVHRYHFNSAMQRMSVIVAYNTPGSDSEHLVCVKGSPEALKPMFCDAPPDYDQVYNAMARRGARVLALGRRKIGKLTSEEVRSMKREDVEKNLSFCGFVIVSCPLKTMSKSAISELLHSSHHVTMITGDNPLTACHVSKELRITRKAHTLIFTKTNDLDQSWHWQSVDDSVILPLYGSQTGKVRHRAALHELASKNDLCLTGEGMKQLQRIDPVWLNHLYPAVRIYARVAPKQKEMIITHLKHLGYVTLMCGDGTNDVGALKHAHVGVSLLSTDHAEAAAAAVSNGRDALATTLSPPPPPVAASPANDHRARLEALNRRMAHTLDEIQKEQEAGQMVRLGDASIAAPFTARLSSAVSVCHIIKQGRCALVTTLQMFKILALNALILAYSHSVLFLEGVKFSDSQATLQALMLAGCFLFITRSKPLQSLSKRRPLPNIFNPYTLLTVLLQFAVHFGSLFYLTQESQLRMPQRKEGEFVDIHADFDPNILNTVVYLISVVMQTTTFAVNYKGEPFMQSLFQNKPLMYSLAISFSAAFGLASGAFPDANEYFQIVIIPDEMRGTVIQVLAIDLGLCFVVDRILDFLLGKGHMKRIY